LSEEQKSRSSYLGIAVFAIVSVLYVLSIGPVGALAIEGRFSERTLKVLTYAYSPIIWLHDHTILEKPLDAYTSLWGF